MLPQTHLRKKKNSSRVNLTISFVFHAVLVVALLYFAAREGLLGKKIQKISVTMVKEKQPEKPKEPEKPKVETPKVETPKMEPPKVAEEKPAAPVVAPPVVAPPNADLPSFDFGGGKAVNTETNPIELYKGYLEYTLRSKWNKPDNLDDDKYVAEVAVNVDRQGDIRQTQWLKGSGNDKWDQSVRDVFKDVQKIDRRPPTNFPPEVTIRFDLEEETESMVTQ